MAVTNAQCVEEYSSNRGFTVLTTKISGTCNRCGGPTSQEAEASFCWTCGHREYVEELPRQVQSKSSEYDPAQALTVVDKRYITLTQAVEYTGYSRSSLRKQIHQGLLEVLLKTEDTKSQPRTLQAISLIDAKRLRDTKLRKTRRNTA